MMALEPSQPSFTESIPNRSLRSVGNVLGPLIALVVVLAFFGIADALASDGGNFLAVENMRRISAQTATVTVAALGMTLIIIAGGIDLSAGTALALCATVLAWCLKEDVVLLAVHGDSVKSAQSALEQAESKLSTYDARIEHTRSRQLKNRLEKQRSLVAQQIPILREQLDEVTAASPRLSPWTPTAAILITVFAGALCGLLNGSLISFLRVVPFIVTLGTMTIYLGLATMLGKNTTVRPDKATQVPDWLEHLLSAREIALWPNWESVLHWLDDRLPHTHGIILGLMSGLIVYTAGRWWTRGRIRGDQRMSTPFWVGVTTGLIVGFSVQISLLASSGGQWNGLLPIFDWLRLPLGVWLMFVFAVILAAVLHLTVFGRYVFALGSNESTARLCGINVIANKIAVYSLAGLFFGISGIYQFSHLSVGNPTSGTGMELNVIAAVVIGGGSLSGGRGAVVGTLTGAAIMAVISSGCTHLELSTSVKQIILGVIIIAAVTVDQLRQRRMGQ